jgi:hypothetical protein
MHSPYTGESLTMLPGGEIAGMKKAEDWNKHCEQERPQRSGKKWNLHESKALKVKLLQYRQRSHKISSVN